TSCGTRRSRELWPRRRRRSGASRRSRRSARRRRSWRSGRPPGRGRRASSRDRRPKQRASSCASCGTRRACCDRARRPVPERRRAPPREEHGGGRSRARPGREADRSTMILVIAEQRAGELNRATWEAVAAAQQLEGSSGIAVAVVGAGVRAVADEVSRARVTEVVVADHPALRLYTPDGYAAALERVVEELSPSLVLLPHTYQTRDLAPKLAARLDRPLVTDVVGFARTAAGARAFTRPMFQGKLIAEVAALGPPPHFVTLQVGAYRADLAARGEEAAPVRAL